MLPARRMAFRRFEFYKMVNVEYAFLNRHGSRRGAQAAVPVLVIRLLSLCFLGLVFLVLGGWLVGSRSFCFRLGGSSLGGQFLRGRRW